MIIVKLTENGPAHVPSSQAGMTFIAECFTDGANGKIAHIRDYRYIAPIKDYRVWSLPADCYEIIPDEQLQRMQLELDVVISNYQRLNNLIEKMRSVWLSR